MRFFNISSSFDEKNTNNYISDDSNIDLYIKNYDNELFTALEKVIYDLVETEYLFESTDVYKDDILKEGTEIFNSDCDNVKTTLIDKVNKIFDILINKCNDICIKCKKYNTKIVDYRNGNVILGHFSKPLYISFVNNLNMLEYRYSLSTFTYGLIVDITKTDNTGDLIKKYNVPHYVNDLDSQLIEPQFKFDGDIVSCIKKGLLGELTTVHITEISDIQGYVSILNIFNEYKENIICNKLSLIEDIKKYYDAMICVDCAKNNKLISLQEVSSIVNKIILILKTTTECFEILVNQAIELLKDVEKNIL